LLGTGVLMLPLAIWGMRHRMLTKRRKKLLSAAIDEFNATHPHLHMRWNRRPHSMLTIEKRADSAQEIGRNRQDIPLVNGVVVYVPPRQNNENVVLEW